MPEIKWVQPTQSFSVSGHSSTLEDDQVMLVVRLIVFLRLATARDRPNIILLVADDLGRSSAPDRSDRLC